jgi:hypothetical protein
MRMQEATKIIRMGLRVVSWRLWNGGGGGIEIVLEGTVNLLMCWRGCTELCGRPQTEYVLLSLSSIKILFTHCTYFIFPKCINKYWCPKDVFFQLKFKPILIWYSILTRFKWLTDPRHNLADFYSHRIRVLITHKKLADFSHNKIRLLYRSRPLHNYMITIFWGNGAGGYIVLCEERGWP